MILLQNSAMMPASDARYFIKITEVRADRLQDITPDAIKREGVAIPHPGDE